MIVSDDEDVQLRPGEEVERLEESLHLLHLSPLFLSLTNKHSTGENGVKIFFQLFF